MAAPTRVSGMVSGMDTESVVKAYVQSYIDKKNKVQKSQTKLTYKQDAWKALNTKVYSLYSKVGSLRFSNSYNIKKTTVSDATKASVTASANAVIGTQSLKISQLAKAGYLTGAQLKKGTTDASTLADLNYAGGETTISVRAGNGDEKQITINEDSKISDVIKELQSAGVNASYDSNNRRIFVSAKQSGVENDFAITASSTEGNNALSALGLLTTSAGDVKGYEANAVFAKNSDGDDYYVRDEEGNIKYDGEGNAITNGTYDAVKTKEAISNLLETLAGKYEENVKLTADNASLSAKVEYSEAYNGVEEVKALSVDGVSGEDLLNLVNAKNDGAKYVAEDGKTYKNVVDKGNGVRIYYNESEDEEGALELTDGAELAGINDKINSYAETLGLITTKTEESEETKDTEAYDKFIANNALLMGKYKDVDHAEQYLDTEEKIAKAKSDISDNESTVANNKNYISENSYWDKKDYSTYYGEDGKIDKSEGSEFDNLVNSIANQIDYAKMVINKDVTIDPSAGATRVTAQDAKIELNGAEYTSSSSTFSINGLNINALAETGDQTITINTTQDSQGMYDKVKDFLSTYNEIINEMQSLYNADSAKGYDPLTDEQKEAMSEKEIEKWEDKIKSAILRRDSSLGTLINKMSSSMYTPININGRGYSLADFGIQTLGYLNASKNEQYAYHIYGDQDDTAVSAKEDKLMKMINDDPDTVIQFMQQLSDNLYNAVGTEMKGTNLRTAYTVYNDKEMDAQQKSYTKSLKEWESKIADMEDRYYKKFSKMEATLAKLQNATSSLTSLVSN